jgi:hypothetical protein
VFAVRQKIFVSGNDDRARVLHAAAACANVTRTPVPSFVDPVAESKTQTQGAVAGEHAV